MSVEDISPKEPNNLEEEVEMMETEEKNNLFDLPVEMCFLILKFLDKKALLSLRLASKKTMAWVDHPRFARKFQVGVRSRIRLEALMTMTASSTESLPWTNYKLKLTDRTIVKPGHPQHPIISGPSLSSFIQNIGPTINTLTLDAHFTMHNGFFVTVVPLLLASIKLESLTLNLGVVKGFGEERNEDTEKLIAKNLEGLKFLGLRSHRGGFIMPSINEEIETCKIGIDYLLRRCSNLRSVELPNCSEVFGFSLWRWIPIVRAIFLDPILQYLENQWSAAKLEDSNEFQLRSIYFEEGFDDNFMFQRRDFIRLVESCHFKGVKLFDVPSNIFPWPRDRMTTDQIHMMNECIVRIRMKQPARFLYAVLPTSPIVIMETNPENLYLDSVAYSLA